jgi:hypothetical protein
MRLYYYTTFSYHIRVLHELANISRLCQSSYSLHELVKGDKATSLTCELSYLPNVPALFKKENHYYTK